MNRSPSQKFWPALFTAIVAGTVALTVFGLQYVDSPLYWWHAAVGEAIATWQRLPDEQLFLYTVPPDQPYVYTSWFGSLITAHLQVLAGPELSLLIRNLFCALSLAILTGFVARRTDRLGPIVAPGLIVGAACFFAAPAGPVAIALPLATLALIALMALMSRPERVWLAFVAPAAAFAIINIDLATALVVIASALAVGTHLIRQHIQAESSPTSSRTIFSAVCSLLTVTGLFGFAYGPGYWPTALTQLDWLNAIPAAAVLIALVTAGLLDQRGPQRPSAAKLTLPFLIFAVAAVALQPGVPSRPAIITTIYPDVRQERPLPGVIGNDLPLRCAEHLRRTGRQLRIFHEPEHAGFLLHHVLDLRNPHPLLFDDHRHLIDDETRTMGQLIRDEPVARGFFAELGINAAVFERQAYPTLYDDLDGAPDWHDLADGIDQYACFVPR